MEEKNSSSRKTYSKHGTRSQKMMSFRLDNDLEDWLATMANKGRYINDLIKKDMERNKK